MLLPRLLTPSLLLGLALGQNRPYPITGVTSGVNAATGERPARLEITTLQNSGPQWDLYILGLLRFQTQQPESDELSYFQIGGIHGRPYIPWNGVGAVAGGSGTGYCPHNDIQFPTWHRPYVALFEQVLAGHINAVASEYTGDNAALYRAAAATWRAPYWDWASNPQLPEVASTPNITINGPTGPVTVPNPLWSYRWQQFPLNTRWFPTGEDRNLWGWPETTRQPDSRGFSQVDVVNSNLADVATDLKDQVYNVLTRISDFNTMASSGSAGLSFENPHNDVHTTMYAIMAYLDYSAFDPIFWMHHANVDRFFALWQAINYNSTFQTRATTSAGQFATKRGSRVDADTPLRPFYRDAGGNFHTGRTVASLAPFGYTYPEINDWSQSKDATRAAVVEAVNRLYGGGLAGSKPTDAFSLSSSGSNASENSPLGSSSSVPGTPAASTNTPSPSVVPTSPARKSKGKGQVKPSRLARRQGASSYSSDAATGEGTSSNDDANKPSTSSPAPAPPTPDPEQHQKTRPSYSVLLSLERAELELPCTVFVYLGQQRAGRLSVPSMPPTGETHSLITLDRVLSIGDDAVAATGYQPDYAAGNSTMIDTLQGQLRAEIKHVNGSITPVSAVPSLKMQVQEEEIVPPPTVSQLPKIVGEGKGQVVSLSATTPGVVYS